MTRIIGAGGGGGCFLGHTLVAVPDGTKRIDKLAVGDIVLSFDDAGKLHEAKVLKVHRHEDERVLRTSSGAVSALTPRQTTGYSTSSMRL
jgi:hypothetical protein